MEYFIHFINPISQVQKHEARDAPYGYVLKYGGAPHHCVSSYGGSQYIDVLSYGSALYREGVPNYESAPYGERINKVLNYEGPTYVVHLYHHHHGFPQCIPKTQHVRRIRWWL